MDTPKHCSASFRQPCTSGPHVGVDAKAFVIRQAVGQDTFESANCLMRSLRMAEGYLAFDLGLWRVKEWVRSNTKHNKNQGQVTGFRSVDVG